MKAPRPVPERQLHGRSVPLHQNGRAVCTLWVPHSIESFDHGITNPGTSFHLGPYRFVLRHRWTSRLSARKVGRETLCGGEPFDRRVEWLETPGQLLPQSWFVKLGAWQELDEEAPSGTSATTSVACPTP